MTEHEKNKRKKNKSRSSSDKSAPEAAANALGMEIISHRDGHKRVGGGNS